MKYIQIKAGRFRKSRSRLRKKHEYESRIRNDSIQRAPSNKRPLSNKRPYSNIIILEQGYVSTVLRLIAQKRTVMPCITKTVVLTSEFLTLTEHSPYIYCYFYSFCYCPFLNKSNIKSFVLNSRQFLKKELGALSRISALS